MMMMVMVLLLPLLLSVLLTVGPTPDALDLGLLMEVAELYCLVCPKGSPTSESTATVSGIAWRPLVGALGDGLADPDGSVLSSFAATCGEALISIAEYLVEDVLLVVGPHGPSGASSAGRASSTNSSRAATSTSSSSRAQGSRTGATSASSAARSSATTSSSHAQRPVAGGNNPGVTLQHRMAWAREALGALALVLGGQQALQTAPVGQTGEQWAGHMLHVLAYGSPDVMFGKHCLHSQPCVRSMLV
jgi:hypothetical protein